MKRTLLLSMTVFLALGAQAQTRKEWFQQKKTQKEYLLKQIAALKVYLNYVEKGYDIVQKGLTIVGDIQGDNFNDHSDHFTSLKVVNGELGATSKVNVILTRQVGMMNMFRELKRQCRNNDYLTRDEILYVDLVYENLLTESERSITALNAVIRNDVSQIDDEGRIERIDDLYDDMNEKYAFARSFCNSTRTMIMQRAAEKNEVESARTLNDVL